MRRLKVSHGRMTTRFLLTSGNGTSGGRTEMKPMRPVRGVSKQYTPHAHTYLLSYTVVHHYWCITHRAQQNINVKKAKQWQQEGGKTW